MTGFLRIVIVSEVFFLEYKQAKPWLFEKKFLCKTRGRGIYRTGRDRSIGFMIRLYDLIIIVHARKVTGEMGI